MAVMEGGCSLVRILGAKEQATSGSAGGWMGKGSEGERWGALDGAGEGGPGVEGEAGSEPRVLGPRRPPARLRKRGDMARNGSAHSASSVQILLSVTLAR